MKNNLLSVVCIVIMCISVLVSGCEKKTEPEEKEVKEEIEQKVEEETMKIIGVQSDKEGVYEIVVENSTGKNIIGFSIKDSSMEEYPSNMLEEKDIFTDGEKRRLYYEPTDEVEKEEKNGDEKVLDPQMDIQLTFEDSSVLVLSAFPFGDVENCEICLDDEVAFIQYESLSGKEHVSTKEAELAIRAQAEAAAAQAEAEAAAAQAEAEAAAAQAEAEAAAAQAEAEAANQQQWQPPQQSSGGYGDGCVNDGLVY